MVEAILSTRLQGTTERAVEEQAMLYEKGCDWFLTSHLQGSTVHSLGVSTKPSAWNSCSNCFISKKERKKNRLESPTACLKAMNESKHGSQGKSNKKKGKTKVRENDEAVVRSGGSSENPHPTQRILKRLSVLSLSSLSLPPTSYLLPLSLKKPKIDNDDITGWMDG